MKNNNDFNLDDLLKELEDIKKQEETKDSLDADDILDEIFKLDDVDSENSEPAVSVEEHQESEEVIEKVVKEKPKKVVKTKTKKKVVKEKATQTEEPDQKKGSTKKLLIALIVLVLVSVAGFFTWKQFFSLESIDYFAMNSFKIVGSEEYGKFEQDKDLIVFADNKEVEQILKEIEYTIEPNEGLKNGDKVVVTLILKDDQKTKLKEHKYKLKSLSHEFTVDTLGTAETFDFFRFVSVKFETVEGKNVAQIIISENLKGDSDAQTQALKQIGVKPLDVENINNGDSVSVELEVSDETSKALLESGITLDVLSKDYTVEGLVEIPQSIADIKILEDLKTQTTTRIDNDYKLNNQRYDGFKIVSTCYSAEPSNTVNSTDYDNAYSYENGSLMFIFEFKQHTSSTVNTMYDAYGYTNIQMLNGNILEDAMKTMSPFQDKATLESIKSEMSQNNFTCD